MRVLTLIFLSCVLAFTAEARPVSYPGGWTLMVHNTGDHNSAHLHISPTAKYSVGYKIEHWRETDTTVHSAKVNNLIKRWNNPNSQANFYLKSGLGVAQSSHNSTDRETELAGFTGIALDWENRRWFTGYENRYVDLGGIDDFFKQTARVGVAPYIGEFGDFHTWLMFEVEHAPEDKDPWTATPLLRFFYGTDLVEIGYSDNDDVMFNWISRF